MPTFPAELEAELEAKLDAYESAWMEEALREFKAGGEQTKSTGTCKPGERADLTGCVPQSGEGGGGGKSSLPSDPLEFTTDNVAGVWEANRDDILSRDPSLSEAQAGALAAARVLNATDARAKEFIDEIDAKVANGEDITDEQDDAYIRAGEVKKDIRQKLVELSGYRPHELLDEHPEATKPLVGVSNKKDGGPSPGDVVSIPATGNRMAFDVKFFPGSEPGQIGIGYAHDEKAKVEMPKESATHFVNDMLGKVDVPPNSGNAVIDAVSAGDADFLGKGNDGLVFAVGDKVAKVSTTVPFQPFNRGHVSPEAAKARLKRQVNTNNYLLSEKGVPGILEQTYVEHGDKSFAIMDRLDTETTLDESQAKKVRRSLDAIHEAGYVVGDQIQVGLKDGEPFIFDLGQAQPARSVDDIKDDDDHFQLFMDRRVKKKPRKPPSARDRLRGKSFFSDCDRDEHGRCKPGSGGTEPPADAPADSPATIADLHQQADEIAADVQEKTKGVLGKLGAAGRWIKDKTGQVFNAMERRYGRKTAIAIFAAGHVAGLATPLVVLPGSTIVGMAPFAALAEVYTQAKRGVARLRGRKGAAGLSLDQVQRLGENLMQQIGGMWTAHLKRGGILNGK